MKRAAVVFAALVLLSGCVAPGPDARRVGHSYVEAREVPYPGGVRICFVAWSANSSHGVALDCPLDLAK